MHSEESKVTHGHETTDADVKPILWFLVVLGLLLVVAFGGMTVLYNVLEGHYQRAGAEVNPLIDVNQIPPGPRLQANPAEELKEVRAWEEQTLQSYEWIDRDMGVFRIPIDRAIEIIAQEGLPARSSSSREQGR